MAATSTVRLGQSTEDYLKAIFKLQEDGDPVSTTSLARALSVSPAAVTKAIRQLASKKLLNYTPYRGVTLTAAGRKVALETSRHHRLLELFLHDVLGYGWDEVDAEAERLEHHISEDFEARIDKLLNYPSVDPHGDPIPSRDGHIRPHRGKPLAACDRPERVVIRRVQDSDPDVLKYLGRLGMRPGKILEVVDKQPFRGPLTVRVDAQSHAVGEELASHVFVQTVEESDR